MNTILPIGSVVRIRGVNRPMMIFGFMQKAGNSLVKVVDYVGVPYPEGNIGPQVQLGFQRSDIVEVLFEGYKTDEYFAWAKIIEEYSGKDVEQSEPET